MRNSLSLLSRTPVSTTTTSPTSTHSHESDSAPTPRPHIPSIRLVSAKPSATGPASDASPISRYPWDAPSSATAASTSPPQTMSKGTISRPSALAPKDANSAAGTKKRLVPKKSRLGLLGVVGSKVSGASSGSSSSSTAAASAGDDKENSIRIVDVTRRDTKTGTLGLGSPSASSTGRGFSIYVDPTEDPDIGEIVVVKKQKSRAALNEMGWGALEEVTNVPQASQDMQPAAVEEEEKPVGKGKNEESKWWSIGRGRGRKDAKEKEKGKDKENKVHEKGSLRARAGSIRSILTSSKPAQEMPPRSKTPDPLKPTQDARSRFNSLDSSRILNSRPHLSAASLSTKTGQKLKSIVEPEDDAEATPRRPSTATAAYSHARAGSPTPTKPRTVSATSTSTTNTEASTQGSIAIRAMRSVRSLARMASWAQLKNDDDEDGAEKKRKDRKEEKEKEDTLRRSFEAGMTGSIANSPGNGNGTIKSVGQQPPEPSLGKKKRSILGIGLPSSMSIRMSSVRTRSSSSGAASLMSVFNPPSAGASASSSVSSRHKHTLSSPMPVPQSIIMNPSRLSVESSVRGRDRSGSVMSNVSSLRPPSTVSSRVSKTSTGSGYSNSGGSIGVSVKWDEEGLENVKEQRRRERADRRAQAEARAVQEEQEEEEEEGKKGKKKSKKGKEKEEEEEKKGSGKKESKKSAADARRRVGIADIFPDADIRGAKKKLSLLSLRNEDTTKQEKRQAENVPRHVEPVEDDDDEEAEQTHTLGRSRPSDSDATPTMKMRPRPVSEQVFSKSRPVAVYEDDERVLSKLEGATNDLAQLINILDLEASPSPDGVSPARPSPIPLDKFLSGEYNASTWFHPSDSPLKSGKQGLLGSRAITASNGSLRPYAQRKSHSAPSPISTTTYTATSSGSIRAKPSAADLLGQPIAPWSTLIQTLSPDPDALSPTHHTRSRSASGSRSDLLEDPASPTPRSKQAALRYKRESTPAPEPEPAPVFQPLKPRASNATSLRIVPKGSKTPSSAKKLRAIGHLDPESPSPKSRAHARTSSSHSRSTYRSAEDSDGDEHEESPRRNGTVRASYATFGSKSDASNDTSASTDEMGVSFSPLFKQLDRAYAGNSGTATRIGTVKKRKTMAELFDSESEAVENRPPSRALSAKHSTSVLTHSQTHARSASSSSYTSAYRQAQAQAQAHEDSDLYSDSDVPDELKVILKEEEHHHEIGRLNWSNVSSTTLGRGSKFGKAVAGALARPGSSSGSAVGAVSRPGSRPGSSSGAGAGSGTIGRRISALPSPGLPPDEPLPSPSPLPPSRAPSRAQSYTHTHSHSHSYSHSRSRSVTPSFLAHEDSLVDGQGAEDADVSLDVDVEEEMDVHAGEDDTASFSPRIGSLRMGLGMSLSSATEGTSSLSLYTTRSASASANASAIQLALANANANGSGSGSGEEEDEDQTKKSFDFTGELRRLSEGMGSSRDSFIEQLENAFKTPAKVDLSYGFLGLGADESVDESVSASTSGVDESMSMSMSVESVVVEVPPVQEPAGLRVMKGERGSLATLGMGMGGGENERENETGIRRMKSVMTKIGERKTSTMRLSSSLATELSRIESEEEPEEGNTTMMTTTEADVSEVKVEDVSVEIHFEDEEPVPQPRASTMVRSRRMEEKENHFDSFSTDPLPSEESILEDESVELPRQLMIRPSDGQLDMAFRFGGFPRERGEELAREFDQSLTRDRPLTLSDIIPPIPRARVPSDSSISPSLLESDDSILRSIFSKAPQPSNPAPQPRVPEERPRPLLIPRIRVQSDASDSEPRDISFSDTSPYSHSRRTSGSSFTGFDSFEEVRRGFEFNVNNPPFYPPANHNNGGSSSNNHGHSHNHHHSYNNHSYNGNGNNRPSVLDYRRESWLSIASVSSYGRVVNPGIPDPFEYGLPVVRERPISEDMSTFSFSTQSVDDTFDFIDRNAYELRRRRVESDASSQQSFFDSDSQQASWHASASVSASTSASASASSLAQMARTVTHGQQPKPVPSVRTHRYREINMSATSLPPVSLYTRPFAYGQGQGPSQSQVRGRVDSNGSTSSFRSDFSAGRLARPGLGDKMFEMEDRTGFPLPSITASPRESLFEPSEMHEDSMSYDERTRDEEEEEDHSGSNDSGRVGRMNRIPSFDSILNDRSATMDSLDASSVFGGGSSGYDLSRDDSRDHAKVLPQAQFRPLSLFSATSVQNSPAKKDDTMVSMIGGGHIRRRSIDSLIDGSPCVQAKKSQQGTHSYKRIPEPFVIEASPPKPEASVPEKKPIASPSSSPSKEEVIPCPPSVIKRRETEQSVLVAAGEEASSSFLTAPVFSRPAPLNRSRSSTCTASSGADTPPLYVSDGSSVASGSISSIDLSQLGMMLANPNHPQTSASGKARARARGHGHRRRISQARASRASIYSVYETIQEESFSVHSSPADKNMAADDDNSTRAQSIFVVDSDTGSIYSVQTWEEDTTGMLTNLRRYYALRDEAQNAVLESKQIFSDTPFSLSELQSFQPPRNPAGMRELLELSVQNFGPLPSELRPRRARTFSRPSPYPQSRVSRNSPSPVKFARPPSFNANTLQPLGSTMNMSTTSLSYKPFSELDNKSKVFSLPAEEESFGKDVNGRPRVGSGAKNALTKKVANALTTSEKENTQSSSMSASESLRINRPRPRGRPAASQQRPIRV